MTDARPQAMSDLSALRVKSSDIRSEPIAVKLSVKPARRRLCLLARV